jgi:large subunit ribosomal protein L7/L12
MNRREHVRARLESVNESLARLRAERSRLLARATQTERKRDTRQKILIGAAVLAAVQHEGVPPLRSSDDLLAWLEPRLTRPHDRATFDLKPHRER